jgi:hypothetical protein
MERTAASAPQSSTPDWLIELTRILVICMILGLFVISFLLVVHSFVSMFHELAGLDMRGLMYALGGV